MIPLLLCAPLATAPAQEVSQDRLALQGALEAACWLAAVQVETPHGLAWPVDPKRPEIVAANLYSGCAGVVLFQAELHAATGLKDALDVARRGADELLHRSDGLYDSRGAGLYTGTAGVAFVLEVVHGVTGEERYRKGATRLLDELIERAERSDGGARWNDSNDVISGSAGTGLYLLWAAERMQRPDALELAREVGVDLVARAREEEAGLSWAMGVGVERRMPNFSHGTAGIAFFLARLHARAPTPAFHDAATKGARHLLSIADTSDGGLRVAHHYPGGEELFYYGWCHGPIGTARLFHQLGELPGGASWGAWVGRCAQALRTSPLPAERVEGLWNTVGQCCGTAGVAQFCLDRFRITGEEADGELAAAFLEDVVARASRGDEGWSWPQAEHRVQPEGIQRQTGYMQGAAGIGLMFLHFNALETGRDAPTRLPDDPFGG